MNTRSVTVGLSTLAHVAAIGLLLALRPAPYADPVPTFEAVEVSIVSEGGPDDRPNQPSDNNPTQRPAGVSAMPFPSLTRWDAAAPAPPSDWLDESKRGMFGRPARPTFKPGEPSSGLDRLGTMLACQETEGSSRREPGRPPHTHQPCAYADLALRAPLTRFQPDASVSTDGAPWADQGYRTFKTIQPLFDESLFPEKVPQANRALKKWFMGLFR